MYQLNFSILKYVRILISPKTPNTIRLLSKYHEPPPKHPNTINFKVRNFKADYEYNPEVELGAVEQGAVEQGHQLPPLQHIQPPPAGHLCLWR